MYTYRMRSINSNTCEKIHATRVSHSVTNKFMDQYLRGNKCYSLRQTCFSEQSNFIAPSINFNRQTFSYSPPARQPSIQHAFHIFKICSILRIYWLLDAEFFELITNISAWINKNKHEKMSVCGVICGTHDNRNSADLVWCQLRGVEHGYKSSDCKNKRNKNGNCTYRISVIGPWSKFHEARLLVERKIPVIANFQWMKWNLM